MRNVTIAEPDAAWRNHLTALVSSDGSQVTCASELSEVPSTLDATRSGVLIIGPSLVADAVFEPAALAARSRRVAVIIISEAVDTTLMRRAMRAGVVDVVAANDEEDEFKRALAHAWETAGEADLLVATSEQVCAPLARVITVFGTKGGVGKSVLATNLGVALATTTGKRVAVVDLDLEFGDVAIMLGMKPERTIHDAIDAIDRLDHEMLAGLMQRHSSGLEALLAPVRPEDAEGISTAAVERVFDLVSRAYDYVVVDTCPAFTEPVLAALDRSDAIYLMTTMDLPSIKNTRVSLQKLRQLGLADGRVRLVLNRSGSKVLLEPGEVAKAIGGDIFAHIPSDRVVPRSVNQGVPVVLCTPKCDVAKSILALAKDAAGSGAEGDRDVA